MSTARKSAHASKPSYRAKPAKKAALAVPLSATPKRPAKHNLKGLLHEPTVPHQYIGELVAKFMRKVERASPLDAVKYVYGANVTILIDAARVGVPPQMVQQLESVMSVPRERVLDMIGIPRSTLARKTTKRQPLSMDESEKVMGAMKVTGRALELMNNDQSLLQRWLDAAIPALGWRRPSELLDTAEGRALLMQTLQQVESGAYG